MWSGKSKPLFSWKMERSPSALQPLGTELHLRWGLAPRPGPSWETHLRGALPSELVPLSSCKPNVLPSARRVQGGCCCLGAFARRCYESRNDPEPTFPFIYDILCVRGWILIPSFVHLAWWSEALKLCFMHCTWLAFTSHRKARRRRRWSHRRKEGTIPFCL